MMFKGMAVIMIISASLGTLAVRAKIQDDEAYKVRCSSAGGVPEFHHRGTRLCFKNGLRIYPGKAGK